MDRKRAYGNAVVPAQAYPILRAIKEAHDEAAGGVPDVRSYLAGLGKRGGRARSVAKKKSSAENGKKGGRPKKNQ